MNWPAAGFWPFVGQENFQISIHFTTRFFFNFLKLDLSFKEILREMGPQHPPGPGGAGGRGGAGGGGGGAGAAAAPTRPTPKKIFTSIFLRFYS
jgi:hypothetical protein